MQRDELVSYLDTFLDTAGMEDFGENGLQVEGGSQVTHVAFAVDACQETIDAAVAAGAQMLVVHHGLFWGKPLLVVGAHRRRLKALLDAGCSLYAVHLPLDRHPEVGNNAELARLLGLTVTAGLGVAFGKEIGVVADAPPGLNREALAGRLATVLGQTPLMLAGGPAIVTRVGIISGGAAGQVVEAVRAGCDTYVTGETSHSHYHDAGELELNVLYAGHYATETVGVKALAAHLKAKFGIRTTFVDRPTGL